jgi:hypothetical protein
MTYQDRWITCDDDRIRIRGYYFPWGTKRIPYSRIRAVRRVELGAARGRARVWGTANPRYWASLDPRRPRKQTALILDIGARVKPFITPDDPDAFIQNLSAHTAMRDLPDQGRRGPLI